MNPFGRAAAGLRALLRRNRQEQELDEELRAYAEAAAERHIAEGLNPADARRAARLEMGSLEAIKDGVRDAGWESLVTGTARDVRYAVRMLGRSPAFTAAAVTTLALGIGATSVIYSALHAVVLRALPYEAADRIVRIAEEVPDPGGEGPVVRPIGLSRTEMDGLRAASWTLSHVGTYLPASVTLTGREHAVRLHGLQLSPAVMAMLGVAPARGRLFEPREEHPMDRVLILRHGAWERHFGSDPDVLGRILLLDDKPYTVIGVMPQAFHFPDRETEFWMPLAFPHGARLVITARVRDGVRMEAARQEVSSLLQRLRASSPYPAPPPPPPPPAGGGRRMTLEEVLAQPPAHVIRSPKPDAPPAGRVTEPPRVRFVGLHEHLVGSSQSALVLLAAASLFVLLIACANIANLLLAQSVARRRELATRLALGAGRGRLLRQMITESLVLAVVGGAAGLGLAAAGIPILRSAGAVLPRGGFGPFSGIPRLDEVGMDAAVLAFAASATILSGVAAGLLPALHHTRESVAGEPLREGPAPVSSLSFRRRGHRAGGVLVAVQVAVATVLFIGGTLLARSFVTLARVDPGYDTARILTFQVVLPPQRPAGTIRDDLLARLAALPGVQGAATANVLPMRAGGGVFHLRTSPPAGPSGPPPPPPPGGSMAPEYPTVRVVSADYARVTGLRLLDGRDLSTGAAEARPAEALINRALAASGYLGSSPVGRHVYLAGPAPVEIVGVVEDARLFSLDRAPGPQVFLHAGAMPEQQAGPTPLPGFGGPASLPAFLVRTEGDPLALAGAIRALVADLDAQAAVDSVATMEQLVANSIVRPRLYSLLLGVFAAIAAALAVIGIYGIMAYSVRQRTREIGVRRALGARDGDIVILIVRQGMVLACTGVVAGLGAAALTTRYLEGMLYGVSPLDAPSYLFVATVFGGVALLASYVPAYRATKIDPAATLRWE